MTEQKSKASTESNTDRAFCPLVQQWLPGYLRYELTAVQHQQIQAHLAQCDSCTQLVQEARLLDADLRAEADRFRPRLSHDASLRIQHQVYRRMQRSLVWRRAGQFVQFGTAVTALILLLAGSFLFGRFWLQSLGETSVETTGETTTLPEAPQSEPTVVPTAPPAIPTPQAVEAVAELAANGRSHAWDNWVAAAPGQTPEQLSGTIMNTALARNGAYLNDLFVAMGAAQQPTANLWLRIGNRCPQSLSASDFEFIRRRIPLPNLASVSVLYDGHLVGEIKMRQVAGEWFATFTRIPTVNPCLHFR